MKQEGAFTLKYPMSGWHDDYHKPQDHSDKADIAKMTNIIRPGFFSIWDIANGTGVKCEK
ncbi:MAG: hypothetical protein JW973_07260 [Bacteroidales bacterium]|nr:hypothetical protein [Bacteroidales bacterium]